MRLASLLVALLGLGVVACIWWPSADLDEAGIRASGLVVDATVTKSDPSVRPLDFLSSVWVSDPQDDRWVKVVGSGRLAPHPAVGDTVHVIFAREKAFAADASDWSTPWWAPLLRSVMVLTIAGSWALTLHRAALKRRPEPQA